MSTKKVLFVPYSVFLLVASTLIGGVIESVVLFLTYVISVVFIFNRGTLSDPRMLFLGLFFFYSTWYSIRVVLLNYSVLEIDLLILKQSVNYSFLAAVTFVVVANAIIDESVNNKRIKFFEWARGKTNFFLSEKLVLVILILINAFILFTVLTSGATSKIGISKPLKLTGSFSTIFLTVIFALRLLRLKKSLYRDSFIVYLSLFMLLFVLVLGERDALFRILFLFVVVFFDKNQKGSPLILMMVLITVAILVPISQAFKAVTMSGELNLPKFGYAMIFSNEFISASRNLYSLMLYEVEHNFMFLYTDLLRAVSPTFLLSDLNVFSSTQWFNGTFRVVNGFSGTSGWGFGIVAQGFLLGGGAGVIVVMTLFSSIICFFYNQRFNSIYFYIFYLLMLTTAIYCIRADMANFISQSFKISGLMIMLVILGHELFKSKYMPNNDL
ncbi:MAG: hypothetical protein WDZ80_03070 [Candidatus Paceibacterota bacterium]